MSKGSIGILNVGAGDTKLVFDKDNPMERARSARIVNDMLKRGYVLFIDTGGKNYQRVLDFKEDVCEYIIADLETPATQPKDPDDYEQGAATENVEAGTEGTEATEPRKRGKPGRQRKSVPATSTTGVAVHRSAGG